MRSQQDKDIIKSYISEPYQIMDFIKPEEIKALIDFFYSSDRHVHKHTGPVTIDVTQDELKEAPFKDILERLKPIIGDFRVWASLYFKTERGHIIHNDDAFNFPVCYKGINIPLENTGEFHGYPELCFFDQYYLEGPSKFFKGSTDIKPFYNLSVYDYSDVVNLTDRPFPEEIRQKYFPNLKESWLEGLSFNSSFVQVPGSIVIFDTVRLHCASDFKSNNNITSKLGLSIFTEKL
jgi:hypothetical protein